MDRLNRLVLGGGLGLILAASGCRTPRSEVPLGRPLVKDPAATTPPVSFSSEPSQPAVPPSMSPPNAADGYRMPPTSANLNGSGSNYLGAAVPSAGPAPALMDSIPTASERSQVPTPERPTFAPPADLPAPAESAPPSAGDLPSLDGGK